MFHAKFTYSNLFHVFFFSFHLVLIVVHVLVSKAFDHEIVFICVCVYVKENELVSHSIYLAFLFSVFIHIDTLLWFEFNIPFYVLHPLGLPPSSHHYKFYIVFRIYTLSVWFFYTFSVSIFDLVDMVKGKSSMLTHRSDAIVFDFDRTC